ncbi:PorP/SprF family type IX secretion system membrane protein [Halocola ammonii]
MKRLLLITIALAFFSQADAQQLFRRTQFMNNRYLVNPAVAGSQLYSPVMVTYRNQWAGFEQAPVSYSMSAHTSWPHGFGFGVILYSDDTGGAISRTGADLTVAYKADLNQFNRISFGLSGMLGQYSFNNSELTVEQADDPALNGMQDETQFLFDATFGFQVWGEQYFFGAAVPNMLQTTLKVVNNASAVENQDIRHYYLMGGYTFEAADKFDIEPSGMMRFTEVTPVQVDVNVKGTYNDMFSAGLTYRHNDAVGVMAGVEYKNFMFFYSYDITFTGANNLSPSTHEIAVGYNIQRQTKFNTQSKFDSRFRR